MEFPTHLSENSSENLEPPELRPQGQKSKRTLFGASEFPEELQSLKLRKADDSRSSLSSSNFTSSATDLPSVSSGGEIDHLLDAYLHPSSETTSSPVLLQSSSTSRSSTAGTENTEVAEGSDTDTDPEGEQGIFLDHSSPTTEESVEENLPDWALQEPEDITHLKGHDDVLASKGIERAPHFFGKGAFGRVYDATIKGDPKSYLYKHYLKPVSFEKGEGKFWRQSDFAAARLHDIPHLVKPLFFIVLVKGADGSQKKIFLPESKVQQFGKSLPPGSNVFLQGQFMEKVPGRPLQALREEGLTPFTPDRPHFRNIAIALHRFLTASRPHNFMHRDLSLNNIIYDRMGTKKVSIIDIGQGVRLRSRGKVEEMMKNKIAPNPASSKVFTGTPDFMAPAVIHQEDYAAEIDTGSTALLLLNLLSEEDFERFSSTRFAQEGPRQDQLKDLHFKDKDPSAFLKTYLEVIGPNSETEQILKTYPEVREVIDLAFRASAPGPAGEAAFAEFQHHPYFAS